MFCCDIFESFTTTTNLFITTVHLSSSFPLKHHLSSFSPPPTLGELVEVVLQGRRCSALLHQPFGALLTSDLLSTRLPCETSSFRVNQRSALLPSGSARVTRLLHSETYLRYIESLDRGQQTQSRWDKSLGANYQNTPLPQNGTYGNFAAQNFDVSTCLVSNHAKINRFNL